MKKIQVFFLVLFLLPLFPVISAIEININSQISQGETVIASVQGNFLDPITPSKIQFYRGHVITSFTPKVAKIGDYYYIYFQTTDKSPNNYSINITGVRYMVVSQVSTQQISKNFAITEEIADFSISEGFVMTSDNFSLKLQNLKDKNFNIPIREELISGSSKGSFGFWVGEQEVENSIDLYAGQIKYLQVRLEGITETTVRNIILSTDDLEYTIPIYIIMGNISINETETNQTNNNTPNNQTQNNETENNQTNNNTPNNQSEIKNCTWFTKLFGCEEGNCTDTCSSLNYQCGARTICGINTNCGNCSLEYNCQTNGTCMKTTCTDTCSSLNYQCGKQNICGVSTDCKNCSSGYTCQTNGTCIKIGSPLSKTCAESKGKICSENQTCANNTITTKDANCCFSNCVEKKTNSNKKIIGWAIIFFLGILILWFFILKFRKTKKTKDTILGGKSK
jgi:hypothetical protein